MSFLLVQCVDCEGGMLLQPNIGSGQVVAFYNGGGPGVLYEL